MKEYNSATETENAKALLHILKEYWKKMAEKEQGFIEIPIENLIEWDEPNGEGCIVSDKITKEGYKVGYMLREEPTEGNPDSGWRFMAGNEDDEYMDNPDNHQCLCTQHHLQLRQRYYPLSSCQNRICFHTCR